MDIFWARVHRRGTHECWEWGGYCHTSGYGHFKYKGVCYKAHRVAYALSDKGPIPWSTGEHGSRGILVCHRCDNRACCNPAHLFLGTQGDNVRDASIKGRLSTPKTYPAGRHHNAKLTAARVRDMRAVHKSGWSFTRIAAHFGVNRCTAWRAVHGVTWRKG